MKYADSIIWALVVALSVWLFFNYFGERENTERMRITVTEMAKVRIDSIKAVNDHIEAMARIENGSELMEVSKNATIEIRDTQIRALTAEGNALKDRIRDLEYHNNRRNGQ